MRIQSKTNFQPISKAGYYKPASAIYIFANDGNTDAYVNNRRIQPGELFGYANDTIYAALLQQMIQGKIKSFNIEETTEFEVRFGNTVTDTSFPVLVPYPLLNLITVQYLIDK
jgi:hypothetical protein